MAFFSNFDRFFGEIYVKKHNIFGHFLGPENFRKSVRWRERFFLIFDTREIFGNFGVPGTPPGRRTPKIGKFTSLNTIFSRFFKISKKTPKNTGGLTSFSIFVRPKFPEISRGPGIFPGGQNRPIFGPEKSRFRDVNFRIFPAGFRGFFGVPKRPPKINVFRRKFPGFWGGVFGDDFLCSPGFPGNLRL